MTNTTVVSMALVSKMVNPLFVKTLTFQNYPLHEILYKMHIIQQIIQLKAIKQNVDLLFGENVIQIKC